LDGIQFSRITHLKIDIPGSNYQTIVPLRHTLRSVVAVWADSAEGARKADSSLHAARALQADSSTRAQWADSALSAQQASSADSAHFSLHSDSSSHAQRATSSDSAGVAFTALSAKNLRSFAADSLAGDSTIFIDSTGTVGIGTTTPFNAYPHALNIVSTDLAAIVLDGGRSGDQNQGAIYFRAADTLRATLLAQSSGKGGALAIQTADTGGAVQTHLKINEQGKTALGHSTPGGYQLDIRNGSGSAVLFAQAQDASGSVMRIRSKGGSTRVFEADAQGRVGIGTEDPGERLDVAGQIRSLGYYTYADSFTVEPGSTDTVICEIPNLRAGVYRITAYSNDVGNGISVQTALLLSMNSGGTRAKITANEGHTYGGYNLRLSIEPFNGENSNSYQIDPPNQRRKFQIICTVEAQASKPGTIRWSATRIGY